MDNRLAFDEDAANYDRARPTYPHALFHDVLDYIPLNSESRALEVGIGTGQATLPFLQTGCRITAIELGPSLAAFARLKFAAHRNLGVLNLDFAEYDGEGDAFDLIYSATAFHWIPPEVGYPQALRLLKPGGAVALFWNHPFPQDEALHGALQEVYARFYGRPERPPAEFSEQDCDRKTELLARFGFVDLEARLYRNTRHLSADDYLALLNTYSDHRQLPVDRKRGLLDGVRATIERFGGTIAIRNTVDLHLGRKPR